MNQFKFIWHKNEKYGEPIQRSNIVQTKGDYKAAVAAFMQAFGNTKKNTVLSVQELQEVDEDGNDIYGEPFTPTIVKQRNGRHVYYQAV